MTSGTGKRRGGAKVCGPDVSQFFLKIQEAAYDGQGGSAAYALDRLALIQAIATTALEQISLFKPEAQ